MLAVQQFVAIASLAKEEVVIDKRFPERRKEARRRRKESGR